MSEFADPAAESTVLAGVFRHGRDAFVDCDGLVGPDTLTDELNQVIWRCADEFYGDGSDRPLDLPSLLSTARRLNLLEQIDDIESKKHVRALMNYPVELETVRPEAGKLFKLKLMRDLDEEVAGIRRRLRKFDGSEPLGTIMAAAEQPIFDFSAKLGCEGHDTKQIGEGAEEWIEAVLTEPRDTIGIPSPWAIYNKVIGGGFRRKSNSMIASRAKGGKTTAVDNIALHVAGNLGIPVFNLDTEMTDEEHWARILAHLTRIDVERIERGDVTKEEAALLRAKAAWLKTIPYYYRSVIDESFDEQVAAMRRWILKTVGTNAEGVRNDCLVIYDYLQLTDPGEFSGNNFKEYQLLGFQMVALNRLIKRYDVPMLSFLQLNREGIDKETTAVAAGSDRIIWKCGNFTILKRKSPEEIAADGGIENGNTKLIPLIARHGPALEQGNWINLIFDGATARLTEGQTHWELNQGRTPSTARRIEVEDDGEDFPV